MNVLYDHQTFSLQTYGGISRYHTELIAGINKTEENQAHVSLLFSNNVHLKESEIAARDLLPDHDIRGRGKFIYFSNQLYSILKLRGAPYDVFHATYYDPYFISYLKKPFVITFHDMIYEKFSSQYKELDKDITIIDNKRKLANKAAAIIAVSQRTKKDVVDLLGVDPGKVQVIYHGSSLPIMIVDEVAHNRPYLLYVGNRGMYKNFLGLLYAVHPLLKKYNIRLLCAGGGAFTQAEREVISLLRIVSFVEQQPINSQSLPLLYKQAVAFLFPSLYEGFGIPILEAFACGCPCIISNTSSLPEVAGEASLYMDPTSPESMAVAVEQLLCDSHLRQTLIEKGYKRLSHFSWQRTVDETLSLYKSIT